MSYYLTKSNPNIWRTQEYLRDHEAASWWSDVCKDAKPEDILFIGICGRDAGIYARATLKSQPTKFCTPDREYYVNPEDAGKRPGADIDANSFRNLVREVRVIPEARLREVPELRQVAKWLHAQGARRGLTEDEGEALDALM